MTIVLRPILESAYALPGDSGLLNAAVLISGLLVLLATAVAEWRITQR